MEVEVHVERVRQLVNDLAAELTELANDHKVTTVPTIHHVHSVEGKTFFFGNVQAVGTIEMVVPLPINCTTCKKAVDCPIPPNLIRFGKELDSFVCTDWRHWSL